MSYQKEPTVGAILLFSAKYFLSLAIIYLLVEALLKLF
jgi:hypothetical protein